MSALVVAAAASYGVHLVVSALAFGWRGLRPGPLPTRSGRTPAPGWRARLDAVGLDGLRTVEVVAVGASLFAVGALVALALFAGPLPAVVSGSFCAVTPMLARRARLRAARSSAMEAWPRLLEELRILTASAGRSIPQALFDVGARAPLALRPGFAAAHREWLLTTDFERALGVLKAALDDATADAVCETLLVAHQVGGTDLDRRLEALVEDRILETEGRKDALAKQAGARFARRFVLIVPVGMALAGSSVGSGRDAYGQGPAQALVVAALACVVACWAWAGRIMRLPNNDRVFDG